MAIELAKWLRREAKRSYRIAQQARRSDEEEKIYEYVASHEQASVRDLQRTLLRGKSSDYVEDLVKRLVKKGRLEEVVQRQEGRGRRARRYRVS